jgi:hypothetical protein
MYDSPIRVGDRVLITTEQGEEEAVVTRIVERAAKRGVWVVETSEHGRVIIMRKRDDSANEWI